MLNRKNQTKIAELQLDEAIALAKSQEDQVRQLVIKQYQELILKQKLLSIKSQTLGNAKVNMEMVEKEFTNGVTTVSEYVRISDITSRIESEYEVTKSDFLLAKKLLEDLAGFSFDSENLN
jgi:outer membrane protein TolC